MNEIKMWSDGQYRAEVDKQDLICLIIGAELRAGDTFDEEDIQIRTKQLEKESEEKLWDEYVYSKRQLF